ncbi:MAG: L-tyrosine/L-tryptophan isonitrile synthase family protein [Methylotenera sp.]|nr:L-tyrosine/L-tryptophan isonitrile synthase family protein [Oligoflexia bacterium]
MLEFTETSIKVESECLEPYLEPSDGFGVNLSRARTRHEVIAHDILTDIMKFRRISGPQAACASTPCQKCLAPHLSKIVSAVEQGIPVTLVLPAFPGKSPNLAKVLGTLPDMAERRALEFLQHLCDRVERYYAPGARIILCSDGRVFSDVVGMRDEDVTAYQRELSRMITDPGLSSISTFDLDDVYDDLSEGLAFDQMRARLMVQYAQPLDLLKKAISRGGKASDCSVDDREANRLYCGITRFLVEDATFPGQTQSRTAIQKECRTRAYAVIQRSQAWGDWVSARFPGAIRLSIHPQTCGAKKLGIRLIEPDHWLTPWHGVAVDVGGRFMLLKRSQAEQLGARLIHLNGRPSHYVLTDENELEKLQGAENAAEN